VTESTASGPMMALPPGQRAVDELPVNHYGRVPRFRPETWFLMVNGATADGREIRITYPEFEALPRSSVLGDLHCCSRRETVRDNLWEGVPSSVVLELAPPADDVLYVMAWAEYGYSATMLLADFASSQTVLATHRNGEPLPPERGWPLRLIVPQLYCWKGPKWLRGIEYLTTPRRGFWEERGHHLVGNVWREERFSYQE
jgi:DMSO/TMAO reductase YedYZ molybdopterin-dependent catalytic subunit